MEGIYLLGLWEARSKAETGPFGRVSWSSFSSLPTLNPLKVKKKSRLPLRRSINYGKCQTVDRWSLSLSLFLCLLLFIVPFFYSANWLSNQNKWIQVVSRSHSISSPGLSFKRPDMSICWQAGYWRGPSLLLNAHPRCKELPQDIRVSWHQVTPCHVTWPPSLHQTRSWMLVSSRTLSTRTNDVHGH